jgi:RHH-type rel operon transcriptional repressor/antitoxin RelB
MTSVQMNVRIDQGLKASGDSVFQKVGITPTEAIRRLWSFASRNSENRHAVASLMESLRDPDVVQRENDDYARRRAEAEAWAEAFQKPVRDCYAQLGVSFDGLPPMTPEEAELLMDGAYDEKYGQWLGLS